MEPLKPAALIRKLIEYLIISEIAVILLGLLFHIDSELMGPIMLLVCLPFMFFFIILLSGNHPRDRLDEINETLRDINNKLDDPKRKR